jgi:hypothetical protein
MAKQLMIYERAVPVSVDAHKDWSVKSENDFGFAREVNSVPVLAAEFAPTAMEYTIIFAGDGDVVFPSVILGMKEGNNAHVKKDGSWDGRYVPAFFRRYPFVFAASEDQSTFTLCIDEEFEGLNKKGKGERLFDAEGKRTQYLENVLAFSTEYQAQFTRTQAFAKRLQDLDLLEPAQAQFSLAGGERTQLTGFKTINREKLRNLPAETLAEMAKTDELELCYLHLQSLNNLTPMTQRIAARDGEAKDASRSTLGSPQDQNKKGPQQMLRAFYYGIMRLLGP